MKILILGKTGQLGQQLRGLAWPSATRVTQVDRRDCDLTDEGSIERTVRGARPDLVINVAAYTAVDRAETEPESAMRTNGEGTASIARVCAAMGAALVHVSTDYVFDGKKSGAYLEDDAVEPLSVYGCSKLAGEIAIRECLHRHVIVRTSWVFSSYGNNFVKTMLRLGRQNGSVRVVADQIGAPTSTRDIARAIGTIVGSVASREDVWGTFHYTSAEPVSWFEFARAIFAEAEGCEHVSVIPITTAQFGAPARRPANSVLDCTRILEVYGIERPSWRAALRETLAELSARGCPA